MHTQYDIVGIGNAIIDLIAPVDPAFLERHGMQPGSMALVDLATVQTLAAAMPAARQSSGGSVANCCAVAACLGARAGFLGKVADDAWGQAFRTEITADGVHFPTLPSKAAAPTACCLILVTPDAQRTMNTYLGACVSFEVADLDTALISAAKILYLEGYLFDPPAAQASFHAAAKMAHDAGRQVALSLSDAFCVARHRAKFLELLPSIDVLFANEAEIRSLYEAETFAAAAVKARRDVPLAVLTRGAAGSVILHGSRTVDVAAVMTPVVDTTGAGDCYAAGFLAAMTRGSSLEACGALGSQAAALCIAHYGARPERAALERLVQSQSPQISDTIQ